MIISKKVRKGQVGGFEPTTQNTDQRTRLQPGRANGVKGQTLWLH